MTRLVRRRIIFGSDGKLDPSIVPASGGGVSDGDKGDITVSASGATWTIDAGVVTTTKLGGDITTAGKDLLDDANAAAQRTTLGLGSAALEATSYFALASHNQAASTINSGTIATARLGSGTADSTTYLRGDSTWQIITSGGGGSAEGRDHVIPSLSNFTWINQGSATATQRTYGVSVLQPSLGSDSLAILKKTAPTPPYTIIARMKVARNWTNYTQFGLLWRESSSGKLVSLYNFGSGSALRIGVNNWNSPTSYNSAASTQFSSDPWATWWRMSDDNTNRTFDMSPDGDEWVNIFSSTRTTFITPDEVGFYVDNNGGGGIAMAMTLLTWEEA